MQQSVRLSYSNVPVFVGLVALRTKPLLSFSDGQALRLRVSSFQRWPHDGLQLAIVAGYASGVRGNRRWHIAVLFYLTLSETSFRALPFRFALFKPLRVLSSCLS